MKTKKAIYFNITSKLNLEDYLQNLLNEGNDIINVIPTRYNTLGYLTHCVIIIDTNTITY
jgi:hypothetical protein